MPGVSIPSQPSSPMGTILGTAGSIVGGMYGGPGGSAAGGKLGGMIGGSGQAGSPGAVQGADAIGRRLQAQQSDPQAQLAQADDALKQLPPEYAQTYGPTIAAARQAAMQGSNQAGGY